MGTPSTNEQRARKLFAYLVKGSIHQDDEECWQSLLRHLSACLNERVAIADRHIAEATVDLTAEMDAVYGERERDR